MANTKARHKEIYNEATRVLEIFGGVKTVDALSPEERIPQLCKMAGMVKELTSCHIDSARRNIAKAMRRARFGIMKDRWGGERTPGPGKTMGPDSMPEDQKRQMASARFAPGTIPLAKAIAEIKGLQGWGRVMEEALLEMVEGDPILKKELSEMGIIVKAWRYHDI